MTDNRLSCTSCGMAPLLPDEEAARLCDECGAYRVVHGVLPDRAWVQERLRRAHGSISRAPSPARGAENERPTTRQIAEIRAKAAEWERLANERPQQFVYTKTTLAVVYLLREIDYIVAASRAAVEVGEDAGWMVIHRVDSGPYKLYTGTRDEMLVLYERLATQWTQVILVRVLVPDANSVECGEARRLFNNLVRSQHPTDAMVERAAVVAERRGVYIASKTKHAAKWVALRDSGVPVVSTWIDEAGAGQTADWADLWDRCIAESSNAAALVLYAEEGETLRGAWTEMGAALHAGVPVFAVVPDYFATGVRHRLVTRCATVDDALSAALTRLGKRRND